MKKSRNSCKDVLLGFAVGDALGVPFEFVSRSVMKINPVTEMIGFKVHNQLKGTWSDDSSLTFCLTEALLKDYDIYNISDLMVNWKYFNLWTPHGEVFDIGYTTSEAIEKLYLGVSPEKSGCTNENSNGNGALMRIYPLLFYIIDKKVEERFEIIKQVTSITHAHQRSTLSCFILLEFANKIINGHDKFYAYKEVQSECYNFFNSIRIDNTEIDCFRRILFQNIYELEEDEIRSTGYVIDTLESVLWCFLTTNSFKDSVLRAVNLGGDTDTIGAITGGLAGGYYGFDNIPKNWLKNLVKSKEIFKLSNRLFLKFKDKFN
jgi:ADP-ribosylglycohydrolase